MPTREELLKRGAKPVTRKYTREELLKMGAKPVQTSTRVPNPPSKSNDGTVSGSFLGALNTAYKNAKEHPSYGPPVPPEIFARAKGEQVQNMVSQDYPTEVLKGAYEGGKQILGGLKRTITEPGLAGPLDVLAGAGAVAGAPVSPVFKRVAQVSALAAGKTPQQGEEALSNSMSGLQTMFGDALVGAAKKTRVALGKPEESTDPLFAKSQENLRTAGRGIIDSSLAITLAGSPKRGGLGTKGAAEADSIAGRIGQGDIRDVATTKKSVSILTPKEVAQVKTPADFSSVLNKKIESLARRQDSVLEAEAKPIKNLNITQKVGKTTVSHNYVNDALKQLEDHYVAVNDPIKAARVSEWASRAERGQLTPQDINNIARLHGEDMSAYNANGQLASGLTRQAAENTRVGLKETARANVKSKEYRALDDQMSSLFRTRKLAETLSEKVNDLRQRAIERGWIERKVGWAVRLFDTITGHALSAALQKLIVPRGFGLKVLNTIEIEERFARDIGRLKKLIDSDAPKETFRTELENMARKAGLSTLLGAGASSRPPSENPLTRQTGR